MVALSDTTGLLASLPPVATPRRERIELAIVRVLSAGGTRSDLRDCVIELVDHMRLRGVDLQEAMEVVRELSVRASPFMASEVAVGDSPADRLAMMVRWTQGRYSRAD